MSEIITFAFDWMCMAFVLGTLAMGIWVVVVYIPVRTALEIYDKWDKKRRDKNVSFD